MSWYSDGEPFDEYEPPFCRYCKREDTSYKVCKECQQAHWEEEDEDDEV